MAEAIERKVLEGINLILSIGGAALGFSTTCKIDTTAEFGTRVTKEAASGKWEEQYLKKLSEKVSASGCVLANGDDDVPTYDQLKAMQLEGTPIDGQYSLRDGDKRTGKTAGGYKGKYVITSLSLEGTAGDDAKYTVELSNHGKIEKVGGGLTESDAASANDNV
ncbi:phage tail tube protein [uncultured Muribaculum sp.]|uniref:phage tail tube protein n=1 Tax=uncultured Muribaculum sp. TaxID=1918613 RepID=UPI0025B5F4C2|nr:phage tail tube protein [uncultured Muribaculum sp.]